MQVALHCTGTSGGRLTSQLLALVAVTMAPSSGSAQQAPPRSPQRMKPGATVIQAPLAWRPEVRYLFDRVPRTTLMRQVVESVERALLEALGTRSLIVGEQGLRERIDEIFRLRPALRTPSERALAGLGKTPGLVSFAAAARIFPLPDEAQHEKDQRVFSLLKELFDADYVVRTIMGCALGRGDSRGTAPLTDDEIVLQNLQVSICDTATAGVMFECEVQVGKSIGELEAERWGALRSSLQDALAPVRPAMAGASAAPATWSPPPPQTPTAAAVPLPARSTVIRPDVILHSSEPHPLDRVPKDRRSALEAVREQGGELLWRAIGTHVRPIGPRGLYERVSEILRLHPVDRTHAQHALSEFGATPEEVCRRVTALDGDLKGDGAADDTRLLALLCELLGADYVACGALELESAAGAGPLDPAHFLCKAMRVRMYDTATAKCVFDGSAQVGLPLDELEKRKWTPLASSLTASLAHLRPAAR